jgi:maleylacetoacetate isomerase
MLTLYDYWRSGAAYRVRIGLGLKGLPYEREAIDLSRDAHLDASFKAHNPQGFVPALRLTDGTLLTQSRAILEWLEETHPEPALLPRAPADRAKVRAIVDAVASDIHPLGNLRVLKHLKRDLGQDDAGVKAWSLRWIEEGFSAIERLLADGPGGAWAWGDAPTLADVFLVPQIYSGVSRYQLDLAPFPKVAAVLKTAAGHDAFAAAHPERQPDAR